MKRCGACGKPKEEREFWKNSRNPDKLFYACIDCTRARRLKGPACPVCGGPTREGRCAPCLAGYGTRWCPSCRALRPRDMFRRDASRRDGLRSPCRACLKARKDGGQDGRPAAREPQ